MPVTQVTPGDSPPPWEDVDDPRRVAHELLGQAHAVLVLAHREEVRRHWCLPELDEPVRDAAPHLWLAVGEMQAAIADGTHDGGLAAAGLGGPLSRPKRRALRVAVERLVKALRSERADRIRKWLKSGAGLSRTAVGSMIKEIPGGEVIAEALDGVLAGLDTVEAATHEANEPQ